MDISQRTPTLNLAKTLGSLAICALVFAGASANAVSSWLQLNNSRLAIRINPFNSEARINYLALQLSSVTDPLDQLEQMAVTGLRYAPSDARFLSVLGVVKEKAGDRNAAKNLFAATLKKLPTEIQALNQLFHIAVHEKRFEKAASLAELIGRRWARFWHLVDSKLPKVFSDDGAFRILAEGLGSTPSGRSLLIESLLKPDRLYLADRLLSHWHKNSDADLSHLISKVTNAFIADSKFVAARSLFRKTRSFPKKDGSSHIFNGEFQYEPSGNPFDWMIKVRSGLSVQRVGEPDLTGTKDPKHNLEIRFRNAPVMLKNPVQNLVLEPGEYQLAIRYRTRKLRAPKPVFVKLDCASNSKQLARLEFASGSNNFVTLQETFRVPAGGCPLQRIMIANDLRAESWKNRYDGAVIVSRISLERLGN